MMDAWNRDDPTLLINILAPKAPEPMTTPTDIDIRVPTFMLSSDSLVIRNDEGTCEEGLTLDEAIAAIRSRYSAEDEVWIDVPEEEPDEDEDEDEQDPDTTWAGVCGEDDDEP